MAEKAGETSNDQGTVRIVRERFAQALDMIVSEPDLPERLDKRPRDTLAELGIEIDNWELAETTARRMAQAIATSPIVGEEAPLVEVVVHVGVSVVVDVVVGVAVAEQVDAALDVQRSVNRFTDVTARQSTRRAAARRIPRK